MTADEAMRKAGLVTLTPRPEKCQICKATKPQVMVKRRNGEVLFLCHDCLDAMKNSTSTLKDKENQP